ncbi:MAG: hypothetical protein HY600_05605 [Candidatus Omnitrophica bacterium]|nr:hypothetical protein [Candidatus Omnitrophota bacterium]
MKPGDWFALALVAQYALAAALYALDGAWPKALCWLGAALIGVAVLGMR